MTQYVNSFATEIPENWDETKNLILRAKRVNEQKMQIIELLENVYIQSVTVIQIGSFVWCEKVFRVKQKTSKKLNFLAIFWFHVSFALFKRRTTFKPVFNEFLFTFLLYDVAIFYELFCTFRSEFWWKVLFTFSVLLLHCLHFQ